MNRNRPDAHALTAAYVLDALDPAERERFAAHLATCEACRREVAEFQATTARLAAAVGRTPSASAKRRTLAAVDTVRQLPPRAAVVTTPTTLRDVLRRRAGILIAAASVLVAASFAGLAVWQHQESRAYEERARQSQQRLDDVTSILAAPDARTSHGRTTNGASTTVVASARQNRAVFTATGLPLPVGGKTYQLWLDHGGSVRPAGFLRQDGSVLIDGDTTDAGLIGLTLEPAGGSPQPTTVPLLVMDLPA
ncbi:anti-sigma factor [Streptomyces sp. NPDC048606]|uniref:anti-sigma factor n=1 Tax=Streptomyces sp. NPDC048606 TaxID=3154726 RepID=UPI00344554BF